MVLSDSAVAQTNSGAIHEQALQVSIQESPGLNIWDGHIGDGFRSSVQSVGVALGATHGLAECGSQVAHHLASVSVSYGNMLGPTRGKGHWYQGNWELRAELFGGAQYSPETQWFVGLTPHLRYNFATGTRWIPFVDAGVGVTLTEIGVPDLGGKFQFNEQIGIGTHFFIKPDVTLSVETYFVHWSNAGMRDPNCGLNGIAARIGLNFFF